ncbi:sensor histidine kinase [Cytobacillus sp. FJAT-54145]|uniref:histidine kinase n=1 Tax=Cytobacillus spartinae TaxID=3299023 RepID=A0ABW6KB57_9BACI
MVMILLLSLGLALVTSFLAYEILMNFIYGSTTLSGLFQEIIEIIGFYKFIHLQQVYGPVIAVIVNIILFVLYVIMFYRREKRGYFQQSLEKLVKEISFVSEGNFEYQLKHDEIQELNTLAKNVNEIVLKLQKSMEEERLAEQAKKDLITNVSHDLRTPLTSIIGFLGLIEQDKYKDETELRYYVQTAYEKSTRLNKLIDDLFEYTRVQNGGVRLLMTPINITEMIGQLAVQFKLQFEEAAMECRQYTSNNKLMVAADGDKLARVFENLITNAIKYGAEGKYIDINAREEDEFVIIDFINYGEQIPSMDLPFIFERFYRVEKSRSESDHSSGLGLAIAKGMIELHGGSIEVKSNLEKTIFSVKLARLRDV